MASEEKRIRLRAVTTADMPADASSATGFFDDTEDIAQIRIDRQTNNAKFAASGGWTQLFNGIFQPLHGLLTALKTAATTPVIPTLTAAGESGEAINVTVQMKDLAGTNVSRVQRCLCNLIDSNGAQTLVAAWTLAETGAGSEVTATLQPSLVIDTDSNGAATVTVSDVSTVFVGTVYLVVTPLNKMGVGSIVACTFS